jgi:hypothetical protein
MLNIPGDLVCHFISPQMTDNPMKELVFFTELKKKFV